MKVAAVNVALGAVTAGAWSAARRKSFFRGFGRGAAAGATVFAGKRIIGEESPLAWWLGREIAAIGSSEVVNAGEGLPVLQRAVIPVGPIRFHIDRGAKRKVVPRLDIVSSVAALVIGSRERTRFALKESVATGVLVFIVPEESAVVGTHSAGIMSLGEAVPDGDFAPLTSKRLVMSHELVHTAQYDFAFTAWSDVAQRAMSSSVPGAAFISRYVDVNLTLPIQVGLNRIIQYEYRPWEKEAAAIAKK